MSANANEIPRPESQAQTPFAIPGEENKAGDARAASILEALNPDDSFAVSEPYEFGYEAPEQALQTRAGQPPELPQSFSEESVSIKQLELRAIFGMDREMDHDEIIQRASVLPGIRRVARVSGNEMARVNAVKDVISNLGFENGPLRLYAGASPIVFIREGKIVLAVQTDGSFAPGVRETLILIARELGS